MLSIQLDDSEIRNLNGLFETFGEVMLDMAESALRDNLEWLREQLPDDPKGPLPEGYPSPLRTDKQRRWFFASVKEGKIPGWRMVNGKIENVPVQAASTEYNLRDSFEVQIQRTPWTVSGDLGTHLPHAPWLIGPDYPGRYFDTPEGQRRMYQARIHAYKDRWWQIDEVLDDELRNRYVERVNGDFWDQIDRWIQTQLSI